MKKLGIVFMLLCLLLSFGGCGKEKTLYKKAEKLMESSSFAQAQALFSSIDDYKDAEEKARECTYLLAKSCMNEDAPDYVQAVRLFRQLGAYKDAIALKTTLQETFFFAEYGYRIPGMECIDPNAHRTDESGKDGIGPYHRYTYTWRVPDAVDEQALTERFMQWLSYADSADGVDTEINRNGTYFVCVDGERLGLVSSQKDGASASVSVVLYDDPLM